MTDVKKHPQISEVKDCEKDKSLRISLAFGPFGIAGHSITEMNSFRRCGDGISLVNIDYVDQVLWEVHKLPSSGHLKNSHNVLRPRKYLDPFTCPKEIPVTVLRSS